MALGTRPLASSPMASDSELLVKSMIAGPPDLRPRLAAPPDIEPRLSSDPELRPRLAGVPTVEGNDGS